MAVNPEIETHRVGLTSSGELMEEASDKNNKWLKISLIFVVSVIIILSAYLVYSKFFKNNSSLDQLNNEAAATPTTPKTANDDTGAFVSPVATEAADEATTSANSEVIPEIPGVNAPALSTSSNNAIPTPVSPAQTNEINPENIDSDNDGLNDISEKAAGTNINVIDTDNDNLSDYEEVNIYKTNPLSADSDGDSYIDGEEVKNGYNPNGAGKLSAMAPKK